MAILRKIVSPTQIIACGILVLVVGCTEKKEQPAPPPASKPAAEKVEPPKSHESSAAEQKPATVSTLAAFYHFDEERGAAAIADSTPAHRSGRPNAGVIAGAEGMLKNAVDFSGSRGGQVIVSDPLNLFTNSATVVAWVKRRGPQAENAAIVFSRGGDSVAGLVFGRANEISYAWGGARTSAAWKSGLVPPDHAWAFIALVIEPEKATMYLGIPGSPLRSAENAAPHGIAEFSGALTFGRDPILAAGFEGSLDEAGIWKHSMSREEVEKLFNAIQKIAAAQQAAPPAAKPAEEHAVAPKTQTSSGGWSDPEFMHAVALYNDAVSAFQKFLQTRQNPSVLKRIEDNAKSCADTFERCKRRAPAGLDMQEYIDRCNKLIFQVQGTRQISP
jgi:hypothetical protein